jgi:asparagine synthase (glutamine-hydrolysing)
MCGIAGIVQCSDHPAGEIVERMTDALHHRGPDGKGLWTCHTGRATLGHRRLAIIDLTEAAVQPMSYADRYHIVYNGEIYNFTELRDTLRKKGYTFRTVSDTEVILAAYDFYGASLPEQLDGMFAFAIWDQHTQELFAARDRFGEKPFYYHVSSDNTNFLFASEPKSFRAAGIDMSVNEGFLLGFLALNDAGQPDPNEKSFYRNILQLPPAHRMMIKCRESRINITTASYWNVRMEDLSSLKESDAIARFQELFGESVRKRLRSDAPIGSSFSGGLDSASIAATIHQQKNEKSLFTHQAFTAGFRGFEKDESEKASLLAKKFDLNCHFIYPDDKTFADEIEKVVLHHEEPIGSSSVYAQYKVFERAAEAGIKVLIDGQGADELLGGYDQYMHWYLQELLRSWQFTRFSQEKKALREAGRLKQWSAVNIAAAGAPLLTAHLRVISDRKKILNSPDLYPEFAKTYLEEAIIRKPAIKRLNDQLRWTSCTHGLTELLRYADRNAMAHGIEVRLPFLQADLAGWLLNIPSTLKIKNGYTKWILRRAMKDILPASVTNEKAKTGFEPPQAEWMSQASIAEKVQASREILVKKKYLAPSVLQKKAAPADAYSAENKDWRYLVAGILLQ